VRETRGGQYHKLCDLGLRLVVGGHKVKPSQGLATVSLSLTGITEAHHRLYI
jgi:hypothetical protein